MMDGKPPLREFGRRVPAPLPAAAPVKRSGHVALLLMGSFAVGGGAYTLMPRDNCQQTPPPPGVVAPQGAPTGAGCTSRGYSSGGGPGSGGSWRSSFYSGDSPSGSADSASHSVTRGGFGSFARAVAAHFSRGG
jgi:hypothetical protein